MAFGKTEAAQGDQLLEDLIEAAMDHEDNRDSEEEEESMMRRMEGEIACDLDRHPDLSLNGQSLPTMRATFARQYNNIDGEEEVKKTPLCV